MKRISNILLTFSIMIPVILFGGSFVHWCPRVNADESSIVIDGDHFPDVNFRGYVSSKIDKDGNGEISESERLSVTSIDVSDKEIHDFTGIAYFPNLEYLDCSLNTYDNVDTYLDFLLYDFYDPQYWHLNSSDFEYYINHTRLVLDVSKNTSLKYLNCSGNLLKEIDVSENTSLETLICRNNALTKLDVSNNTKLKHLDCSNNIKSSDLGIPVPDKRFNPIETLNLCESADLSYLDISGTLLTSIENKAFPSLEYLDCSRCGGWNAIDSCGFSSLDVSMNTALKHLALGYTSIESINVSGLSALEYLDVSGTALTTLDVSGLSALEYLDCSSYKLQDLVLSSNSSLKHLDVSFTKLTALDVSVFKALERLDCAHSQIDEISFSKENSSLKLLDISYTRLQDVNVMNLSALEVLDCGGSNLSTINISKNPMLKKAVERGSRSKLYNNRIEYSTEDYRLCFSETTELINLVPIDPLYFPDENFRKYVSETIDGNGDGFLDDDEILSVDSIDVAGQSITDLSGIEFFVNLSKLNCSNNQITELCLSYPRLCVLICHDNPISQLIIGRCFGLKDFLQEYPLTINGNKKTSSHSFNGLNYQFSVDSTVDIDTVGGVNVNTENFPDGSFCGYVAKYCDTDRNRVLSADEISQVKKIDFAYLELGWISDFEGSFDYTEIKSLEGVEFFVFLEQLDCSGTMIKSLDVSRNTNLEYLRCDGLGLTSLAVSKNLSRLRCGGNKITSLDLSNNSELKILECSQNLLTELDISNCSKLCFLNCAGNEITKLDLQFCPLLENIVIQNTKQISHDIYTYGGFSTDPRYTYGSGSEFSCCVYRKALSNSEVVSISVNTILQLSNCDVIFDAKGGTGVMEKMTVEKGTSITLPENQFTAPAGKVFDKWSVGKPGEKYQVMSTVTVSAVWKDAPVTPTVTKKPTAVPTGSDTPTPTPSKAATLTPTKAVTPTKNPTIVPTKAPSGKPATGLASVTPSVTPVGSPTKTPTTKPGDPTPTSAPGQPTRTPVQPTPTTRPGYPTPTPSEEKEPSIEDFVERLYTIALNREAEKAGKDFWVNEIISGNRTGGDCAHFFLIEAPEFLNRGLNDADFVETLYRTFFDRLSEPAGKAFWVGELKSNRMSRQDVIAGFIDSKEWCNICATYGVRSGAPTAKAEFASKNAIAFATRLYTCCLSREPEDGGLKYWSLALTNLEKTGCEAAAFFFTSDEFVGFGLQNDEFVRRLYTTFMGRDPESSEISYWVGEIAKGKQTKKSVMQFFGSSEEFTNICKTYGIERGAI